MTDKPSASERRDELAEAWADECFTGESALKRESHFSFKAGYDAAVKEGREKPLSKLKLEMKYLREVEQIAGGTARELSDLRQANAALTKEIAELAKERDALRTCKASKDLYCDQVEKEMGREIRDLRSEVAELKAERESHFALEESVLRELKAERDELKLFVSSVELHESIAKAKAVLKERDELRSGIDAFKYAADQNSIATNAWKLQAEILAKILSSINVQQIVNGLVGQELRATEITIALAEFEKFREGK